MAGLVASRRFGPKMLEQMRERHDATRSRSMSDAGRRQRPQDIASLVDDGRHARRRWPSLPIALVCMLAGVAASVGQVGFKPSFARR